jgi:hypothetical protein
MFSRIGNRAARGFIVTLLLIVILDGCLAVSALNGKPGVNSDSVRAGISRAEVETIVGRDAVREWTTSEGITYCVYRYDDGVPPSPSDAAAHLFMDGVSWGLWELFAVFKPLPEFRKIQQMAVSYDTDNRVIGVFNPFGDFDVLPADGRAGK